MGLIKRIQKYYSGVFYIFTVMALLFAGHFTAQEALYGSAIVLTFFIGCCTCDDFRFALFPFISFISICSKEHNPANPTYSTYFFEQPVTTAIYVNVALILAGFLIFGIRNRHHVNKPHKGSGILGSLALFAGLLFFNGLGSETYQIKNIVLPFLYFVSLILLFLYFSAFIRFDRSVFDYFMLCLVFFAITIDVQILEWVINDLEIIEGHVNKNIGFIGWGFFTTVGGLLAMLLPAGFYFAKDHKHGWIGYCTSILTAICIILAQSRGGMLWGGIIGVICVINLCISGKNRTVNRWLTFSFLVIGLLGVVAVWDKISLVIQNYLTMGFDDNGRFNLWKAGIQNLLKHPLLGAGFYDPSIYYGGWTYQFFPYMCHNTVLELLSAGGLIITAAYLVHRWMTVVLFFRKPNSFKMYAGFCVLGIILFSMTDLLFFLFYPTFTYSFLLMMMERSDEFPSLRKKPLS